MSYEKAEKQHFTKYLVAKKELSDRNWQRQKRHNAPNIPEGTRFIYLLPGLPQGKFVTLQYKLNYYQVKASDLEVVEDCCYNYHDSLNQVVW